MTAFWIAAAGLTVLAWLLLATPILQTARTGIATSRTTNVGLGLGIAAFSFVVYGFLGNIDAIGVNPAPDVALNKSKDAAASASQAAIEPSAEAVQSMLNAMVGRMQAQPAGTIDAAGWTLVARSYASIKRYENAHRAFELAIALSPGDESLRAEQAQLMKHLPSQTNTTRYAGTVKGSLRIAPDMASRILPTDTVFVFAHEAGTTGMPIAAARYTADQLPLNFTLDESTPMRGGKRLSEVDRLVISARVSRNGDAKGSAGDPRGESQPVESQRDGVQVLISSTQP